MVAIKVDVCYVLLENNSFLKCWSFLPKKWRKHQKLLPNLGSKVATQIAHWKTLMSRVRLFRLKWELNILWSTNWFTIWRAETCKTKSLLFIVSFIVQGKSVHNFAKSSDNRASLKLCLDNYGSFGKASKKRHFFAPLFVVFLYSPLPNAFFIFWKILHYPWELCPIHIHNQWISRMESQWQPKYLQLPSHKKTQCHPLFWFAGHDVISLFKVWKRMSEGDSLLQQILDEGPLHNCSPWGHSLINQV